MATAIKQKSKKPAKEKLDPLYIWTGVDRNGKKAHGEARAPGEAALKTLLRKQGINANSAVTAVRPVALKKEEQK